MKAIQKDPTGTKKKKNAESKPVQNVMPASEVWRKRTPTQEEINNRVVRSADRGRVETDPTQGWVSKLNKDILYNRLPNKQILQKNGDYVDLKNPQYKVIDSRFPNGVNVPPNKKEFTDSYKRAMEARGMRGRNKPLGDEEKIFRSKPKPFKKKK